MDEIEKLEAQKVNVQQQAAFELGRLQGRIDLLKEQLDERTKAEEEKK